MSRLTEMEAFLVVVEEGQLHSRCPSPGRTKSAARLAARRVIGCRLGCCSTTRQLTLTEVGRAYHESAQQLRALSEAGG